MGTYIGHCDSCDITIEAGGVILDLAQRYSKEKVIEILKFSLFDVERADPTVFQDDLPEVDCN